MTPLPASPSSPWWHREFAHYLGQAPVSLAPAAFALSAHGSRLARHPDHLIAMIAALHDLAGGISTIEEWRQRIFVDAGFTGNGADYHDVRNSFLPDVLSRRLGLPITLALVGHLVADIAGLVSWGIGMPGHFLLGIAPAGSTRGEWRTPGELASDPSRPSITTPINGARIVDAFNGGRFMSERDVAELFVSMFGRQHQFHLSMLDATSTTEVLVRMLNNLKSNYARSRDLTGLCAVSRLRTSISDFSIDEGRELIRLLTATGSLDEAVLALDELVMRFPEHDEVLEAERVRLAASLN